MESEKKGIFTLHAQAPIGEKKEEKKKNHLSVTNFNYYCFKHVYILAFSMT